MIYNDISVYLDMYIICTVFIYIYIIYFRNFQSILNLHFLWDLFALAYMDRHLNMHVIVFFHTITSLD